MFLNDRRGFSNYEFIELIPDDILLDEVPAFRVHPQIGGNLLYWPGSYPVRKLEYNFFIGGTKNPIIIKNGPPGGQSAHR
jgi:hypothetical protein